MRIAFTSCFSAEIVRDQPVWQDIAAGDPDVLVLLGDSIYLDCSGRYDAMGLQQLAAWDFARYAHALYRLEQELDLEEMRIRAVLGDPRGPVERAADAVRRAQQDAA